MTTTAAKTATRAHVLDLARSAADGRTAALRAFAALAKRNGYHGRGGGWIYADSRPAIAICQGWQALADHARRGAVPMLPEAVIDEMEREQAERDAIRRYDARVAELRTQGRQVPQAAHDCALRRDWDRAMAFLRDDVLADLAAAEANLCYCPDPPAPHQHHVDDDNA